MMSSAQTIKKIRLNLGLSQEMFGYKLNISKSAVCNYEKGVRTPRFPIIKKMRDLAKKSGMDFSVENFLDD